MSGYSLRADIVLATKAHGKMHDGPGGSGLSRKVILEQLDGSLPRLGTDHLDVLAVQTHHEPGSHSSVPVSFASAIRRRSWNASSCTATCGCRSCRWYQ